MKTIANMIRGLSLLAAVGASAAAHASWTNYGTYYGDGFLTSYSISNVTSNVNVTIKWFANNTNWNPMIKVKIWDRSSSTTPRWVDTFPAYTSLSSQVRNYGVFNGPVRVELYAVGSQWPTTPNLSTVTCNYFWLNWD